MSARDAVIVSTARTPIGRAYKGAFNATPGATLGALSLAPAIERAGKVFNILKSMSLNPPVLRASMELYKAIMFGESGLSRKERELLATVTSAQQFCRY